MTDAEYQKEYFERKARRFLEASQHATRVGTVRIVAPDGRNIEVEVRKAYRSRGYRSGYAPVLTYWALSKNLDTGRYDYATSYTENAFAKERVAFLKQFGVQLPS